MASITPLLGKRRRNLRPSDRRRNDWQSFGLRALTIAIATFTLAIQMPTQSRAGELDPSHVSADAQWLFHIDYEALSDSDLVKALRQHYPGVTQTVQGWMNSRYGIDPPQDLKSATLFSSDYQPYTGVVLIQADYKADAIEARLRKAKQHSTSNYQGQTLHTVLLEKQGPKSPSGDKEMTVVMVDEDTLLLVSSIDRAKSVLDLLNGKTRSLADTDSPLLAGDATKAWIYGAAKELNQIKEHPVAMPVLAQHQQISWSFGAHDDGKLYERADFVANDEAVAEKMKNVLEGAVAYETLWSEGSKAMTNLMQNVSIEQNGATTRFNWQGESEQLADGMTDILDRVKTWVALMTPKQRRG